MSAWKILFKSTFRSGTYSKTCVAALCTPENVDAAMQQRDGNKRDDSTVLESLKALVPGDCHCLSVDAMNTALIVPWPFNQMVARGFWTWLAMPSAAKWPQCSATPIVVLWRRFELSDIEPRDVIDAGEGGVEAAAADAANLLQPRMFQELADYIRDRATVLEAASEDSRVVCRCDLGRSSRRRHV